MATVSKVKEALEEAGRKHRVNHEEALREAAVAKAEADANRAALEQQGASDSANGSV